MGWRTTAGCALGSAALTLALAAPVLGDVTAPQITIIAPASNTVFDQILHIEASATDADGLGKITFKADGKLIRNFTVGLANGKAVSLDWRHARELSPGEHTITVEAVDKYGSNLALKEGFNRAVASVKVRRIAASSLTKAKTQITMKLSGSGRNRTLTGQVTAPTVSFSREVFPLTGKVRVFWEIFSNKRWKVRHKDSDDAAAPYRFRQRLAQKGRWRVHVIYEPEPPYAASQSKTIAFAVKR